jgi:hypothetical protein
MTTNERVIVLNLLREGKISTGDAEQLLHALSEADRPTGGHGKADWKFDEVLRGIERDIKGIDVTKFTGKVEGFFDDLRKRFSEMAWDGPNGSSEGDKRNVVEGTGEFDMAAGSVVHISQKGGEIRLVPNAADRLRVSAPLCYADGENTRDHARFEGVGGTLEVAIPTGVAKVYIEATGCQMSAEELDLDSFTARIVGGSMRVRDVAARLNLNLIGGSIHLTDVVSADVDAETNGGSISADLGAVHSGAYKLTAAGGGVTVDIAAGSGFEVSYTVTCGVFESQWGTPPVGEDHLRVGDGGASFDIVANGGSIALRQSESS